MINTQITEHPAPAQEGSATPREIKNAILAVLTEDDKLPSDPSRPFIPTRVLGLIDQAIERANRGDFK